jgi:soluble cytochrome b562
MFMHLKNLERILKYTLKETSAEKVFDTLYGKTEFIIEQHITQRDSENFIAYLKFLSESNQQHKVLTLERKLVQDFINRTYSECGYRTRYSRTKNLYNYFENKLGKNVALNNKELTVLYEKLKKVKKSTIERVMVRVCIALILKWLQGVLKDKLSEDLKGTIAFLATVYGMYGTNRVFTVNWHPYKITKKDAALISSEYKFFETAITDAIKYIKEAIAKKPFAFKYRDQFQIVLSSIDNLIRMSKEGKLDSVEAFKNKIIIAAVLIYLQDEFVKKDADLNKFINLFVSFYYQFRDKRYIPVFTKGALINQFS